MPEPVTAEPPDAAMPIASPEVPSQALARMFNAPEGTAVVPMLVACA